jgi:enterobactin synthetase component D / holo-[acyl-carrier protein] synthase
MIEQILPPEVASSEAFDDAEGATLFPEEEAVIARAVAKRRSEFATGRACARAALAKLGLPPAPILPGERRAPQWPAGVAGSITHCAGYRAAAVARVRDVVSLGLDAEPNEKLPDGVLDHVSLAPERARLPGLAASVPGVSWDRLLFCAKESVYKAWYPLTGRWLGFEQAEITVEPEAGTFCAELLEPGPVLGGRPLAGFTGRWLARDGLLLTAIAVPAVPD